MIIDTFIIETHYIKYPTIWDENKIALIQWSLKQDNHLASVQHKRGCAIEKQTERSQFTQFNVKHCYISLKLLNHRYALRYFNKIYKNNRQVDPCGFCYILVH